MCMHVEVYRVGRRLTDLLCSPAVCCLLLFVSALSTLFQTAIATLPLPSSQPHTSLESAQAKDPVEGKEEERKTAKSVATAEIAPAASSGSPPNPSAEQKREEAASSDSSPSSSSSSSSSSALPTLCSSPFCPNPLAATKRCTGCLSASYCSRECQLAARKGHRLSCIPLSELTLVKVQGLEKHGPLGLLPALTLLSRLHQKATAANDGETVKQALQMEMALRQRLKPYKGRMEELFAEPVKQFQAKADAHSTYHLTFQNALNLTPAHLLPQPPGSGKKWTARNPLTIYFLGARDDMEGRADFGALANILEKQGVEHSSLWLIGLPPIDGRDGLTPAPRTKIDNLTVRRLTNPSFPKCLSDQSLARQPAHLVFVSRGFPLDASVSQKVRFMTTLAIDVLANQKQPPVVYVAGGSRDLSIIQQKDVLEAFWLRVILSARSNSFAARMADGSLLHAHLTIAQGAVTPLPASERYAVRRLGAEGVGESTLLLKGFPGHLHILQRLIARGFDVAPNGPFAPLAAADQGAEAEAERGLASKFAEMAIEKFNSPGSRAMLEAFLRGGSHATAGSAEMGREVLQQLRREMNNPKADRSRQANQGKPDRK